MKPEEIVTLMIPVTFFVMHGIEPKFRNGRNWREIPWWRAKDIAFFIVLMTVNAILLSPVPPEPAQYHLFDGARRGVAGGTLLGYLAVSLANTTVHRTYDRYRLLWRYAHQLHHSPQRVDISGATVFTPLEVINNAAVSFAVMVFALGLDSLAAACTGYTAAFYGLFQHFNIRTPRWPGYAIQRPESHGVHHWCGYRSYNYSDLPIWDVLWGTFRNPPQYLGEVGFEHKESARMGAMLIGRDVNASLLGPGSRRSADPATNPA